VYTFTQSNVLLSKQKHGVTKIELWSNVVLMIPDAVDKNNPMLASIPKSVLLETSHILMVPVLPSNAMMPSN